MAALPGEASLLDTNIVQSLLSSLVFIICSPPLSVTQQQEYDIECDNLTTWKEGNIKFTHLVGNVQIKTKDFRLKAESVLLRSESEAMIEELYARGHVLYNSQDTSMRCSELYYNLKVDKALATNPSIRSFSKAFNSPLVIRAKEMKKNGPGLMEFSDADITTCELASPHYHGTFSKVTIQSQEKETKGMKFDLEGAWKLTGYDFRLVILGLPVFYFPVMTFSSGQDFIIRGLRVGKNDRFGYYLETEWGVDIKKSLANSILGKGPTPGDHKNWGTVKAEIDYRQLRGFAGGIDLKYEDTGYTGFLDTYYLRDHGPNELIEFERKFIPLEDEDRYRAKFFHRTQVNEQMRIELETSYLSDRNILEEFFRKEFFEGKEQETAGYMRMMGYNKAIYAYERYRLNDFQTQIEYLPKLKAHVFSEEITSHVFLSSSLEAARLKRNFDEILQRDPFDTQRIDFVNELSSDLTIADINFTPFAIGRYTYYDKDLKGDEENRIASAFGLRSNINFLGIFGDFRHQISLDMRYAQNFHVSVNPRELYKMDEVDEINEFEEIALGLKNSFRQKDLEFLMLSLGMEYYPDRERDTGFLNANSFSYPFYYITNFLIPTETFEKRAFSNLHSNTVIRPLGNLTITSSAEYSTVNNRLEVTSNSVYFSLGSFASASFSQYYLRNGPDAHALSVNILFSDKWRVIAQAQYDFNANRFTNQTVKTIADFHDVTFNIIYERDFGRNDQRFFVTLLPKILTSKKGY